MSYAIFHGQKPEIDSGDRNVTPRNREVQITQFGGLRTTNDKQHWPVLAYSSVEMFHKDYAI